MRPFVTFQTLAYNSEKHIAQTIESVLSQSCTDFEYQIRDNGSTDRTGEIIESYAKKDKRIIYYKNEINVRKAPSNRFLLQNGRLLCRKYFSKAYKWWRYFPDNNNVQNCKQNCFY